MEHQELLPSLSEGDNLREYAGKLRTHVIDSQRALARQLGIHHGTVASYEDAYQTSGRDTVPPLGYIAYLMTLNVEKARGSAASSREIGAVQQYFVDQLKSLLTKFSASYKFRFPFRTWEEIEKCAAEYLEELAKKGGTPQINGPVLVPPLPEQGVFGRDEILASISKQLAEEETPHLSSLALRGMGGIGKSTLAMSVGRDERVLRRFTDGVLWAELGPKPDVRTLLTIWGEAFRIDVRPEKNLEACEARLRETLYSRNVLLIIDDIWDVIAGKHFLVGGPKCRTLITTRERSIAHDLISQEHTVNIGLLSPEASLQMLESIAPNAVRPDVQAAERLCEKLEFLPLGIKLAGRLLANESDLPSRMKRLIDELSERGPERLKLEQSEGRKGISEEEPVTLGAILGLSVDRLDRLDKERFAMASLFGGEPLTWRLEDAIAVWDCAEIDAEATISNLIKRALVDPRPNGKYWMHALLADYAADLRIRLAL